MNCIDQITQKMHSLSVSSSQSRSKGSKPLTDVYGDEGTYTGEMVDDKADGRGSWEDEDGNKYVGDWKDDKKNGHGTYTFKSGEKYVGDYKDDKRNGHGTYA